VRRTIQILADTTGYAAVLVLILAMLSLWAAGACLLTAGLAAESPAAVAVGLLAYLALTVGAGATLGRFATRMYEEEDRRS